VHAAAQELQADARHVLVIGKPGHVEVQGIVEDLQSYDVVAAADEVRCYGHKRLGIVCQTTVAPDVADAIRARIQLLNPLADVRSVDTICQPTRLRQRAMLELLTRVDAVVVVGGRNSNNTRQLARLCHEHLVPVWHVENAGQLDPAWFAGVGTVGLTAGTSTLDSTIDAVHEALAQISTSRSKGTRHASELDSAGDARRTAT
jgi:4-hydroxy-3-methylbut-2-enyl diphosphate reductase